MNLVSVNFYFRDTDGEIRLHTTASIGTGVLPRIGDVIQIAGAVALARFRVTDFEWDYYSSPPLVDITMEGI